MSPLRLQLVRAAFLSFAALSTMAQAAAAQATPVVPTILSTLPAAPNPELPLPDGLRAQVEFWKSIFSRVRKDEVVFHDRRRLDVVYGLLRVPEALTAPAELANQAYLEARREGYRAVLRALADGFVPDTLSGEALRIYALWGAGSTPGTFAEAEENVRWQRGLRERFIEGLAVSGRYQPHIEQVFREERVPLELTFLPFVESMYITAATSSAGAVGVWQFMPGTGRLFMRVDRTIDERLDPIRAARGAARLLRRNYERLGTWPLAVTAYNHGPYGMMNAVRTMGTTSIEKIVKEYEGPSFGFASRNFYAEFLAALEVRRNFQQYFGTVRLDPPLEFEEVTLPFVVKFSSLAQALAVPVEALWDMNPAFTANARRQDRPIPAGHSLRLPTGLSSRWGEAVESLRAGAERAIEPAPRGSRTARAAERGRKEGRGWYVVRPGDSLSVIAERHGLSLSRLQKLNGLSRRAILRPGQRLRISR